MNADRDGDAAASRIAAAIGEPARARILYCLLDNRARTSTELAVVANVTPSTASVHLNKLKAERLIKVLVQGKHHYYSLHRPDVAALLESLSVLAGCPRNTVAPNTPNRLRVARTCYDHIAGTLGVSLHDRFQALKWLSTASAASKGRDVSYELTLVGTKALESLGIELVEARIARRQFAFPCLDWSERRSHIGGSLGAAVLELALKRKWVTKDLDSRALSITSFGRREILAKFGLQT